MSDALLALKPFLSQVAAGRPLTLEEARQAFEVIMSGQATPAQIAGFLVALRMRGETVEEITAAAEVIRARALPVRAPEDAMDIVGTGGDGAGTLNISTATALVVAGCGVTVAKHGNRALSSRSGSADVLTALGVNLAMPVPLIEHCLKEAGIGFMLAPRHHESFRHVGPVRAEMGIRTVFNILGPLCNPAGVKRYLLGVYAAEWVRPLAEVLLRLGCERAWVVHGADGLDELSTTGENLVCELADGELRELRVSAADAGLEQASLEALKGGDGAYNAQRLQALLEGERDAYRDIVVMGAAASLMVAGKAADLREGAALAAAAIDDGRAAGALEQLRQLSHAGDLPASGSPS